MKKGGSQEDGKEEKKQEKFNENKKIYNWENKNN